MATPPRRPSLQRNAPLQTLATPSAQSSSTASPTTTSFSSTLSTITSPTTSPTTTSSTPTLPSLPTFAYTSSPSISPTRTSSTTFPSSTTTLPAIDNTTLTRTRYNSLPSLSPRALQLSAPAVTTATPRGSIAFGSGESWTLQPGFGFSMNTGTGSLTPQDMLMDGMMTPRRSGLVVGVGWAVDADGDALMMDVF